MKFKNIDIQKSDKGLHFLYDDGKLINVEGEGVPVLSAVISELKKKPNLTAIQLKERIKFIDDIDLIEDSINWLKSSGIITNEDSKNKQKKNILFLGDFNNKKIQHELNEIFNREENDIKYVIDCASFDEDFISYEADIIVIIGSILKYREKVIELNSLKFLENVILINVGLGDNHINLGPLCHKEIDTPCLESYIKRKISNLKDPKLFLSSTIVDGTGNQLSYAKSDLGRLFNLSVELLRLEINSYLTDKYSSIIGRCITYDIYRGELYKSKVLPVHNLSYKGKSYITPFN